MDSPDDSPSCETCGVLFNSVNKLLQHTREQHWGKEEAGAVGNAPSASDDDASQDEDADVSEQEGENASREGVAFSNFFATAVNAIRETDEWEDMYNQEKMNRDDDDAMQVADDEMNDAIVAKSMDLYQQHLENDLLLQDGATHEDVYNYALKYWQKGYDADVCAKMAINKYRPIIEELMESDSEMEKDDEPSQTDSDDDDAMHGPVRDGRYA